MNSLSVGSGKKRSVSDGIKWVVRRVPDLGNIVGEWYKVNELLG